MDPFLDLLLAIAVPVLFSLALAAGILMMGMAAGEGNRRRH